MTMQRIMDRLADVDTRFKVLALFFTFSVLPAGLSLYLVHHFPPGRVVSCFVLYLVVLIVIQFPLCALFSHLLVRRNLSKINAYCQQVKRGVYRSPFDLPPEKGEENDFLRAKRNLFWMGQIIASREAKLVETLDALKVAQSKVMESIQYASRIQHGHLPPQSVLGSVFRDHFVWWEPRDIVGGDTYWLSEHRDGYTVAAIDCTGHGVAGAFMTLIVHALMEQSINPGSGDNPAGILELMNRKLKAFFHHEDKPDQIDDGFDAAVCHIDPEHRRMVFAGAGMPVFLAFEGAIMEIKGDRTGVGDRRTPLNSHYTNRTIDLAAVSGFYLATDGVIDQIGGPKRLPFGKKRLKRVLNRIQALPFTEQKSALTKAWRAYAGREDIRDDLTVLGFSL